MYAFRSIFYVNVLNFILLMYSSNQFIASPEKVSKYRVKLVLHQAHEIFPFFVIARPINVGP